jgi:mannan endo-1,4-beta-mannosidase
LFEEQKQEYRNQSTSSLAWIETVKGVPYFIDEYGKDWTPVGQNDAITWIELAGAFRRRDFTSVENYFKMLAAHKVSCLRLMLEYCQGEHRYLERPVDHFQPNMIRLWDDIFALCEKYRLRILLTPFDTFWMWKRWKNHPYNRKNGGICAKRSQWLLCSETRSAIKNRLAFAAERWGASGALFAWDIWNEIHPSHAARSVEVFGDFVEDISGFLRKTEMRLYGRTHPQTVSVFNPVIDSDRRIAECIFRHPSLDFASTHFYEKGTIDNPKNTVDAAVSVGRLTRQALTEIIDERPFFDSEHGPIYSYKNRKITLSESFDDEYFRHIQWAHFASGGAGGGMRWAYRNPHKLTEGMRTAQQALSNFLPLVNWQSFYSRRNLNREIELTSSAFAAFGCGNGNQSIVWLLRTDNRNKDGTLRKDVETESLLIKVPGLINGKYRVTAWDTASGSIVKTFSINRLDENRLCFNVPPIKTDLALIIKRISA